MKPTPRPSVIPDDHAEAVLALLVPQVLPRLGAWALRTQMALPANEAGAPGYRDLAVASDGCCTWQFPRSNSAERIAAFLWLGTQLANPACLAAARHYADAMADDPARGIYGGPEAEGDGHVWYWRDSGLYMTNYTMRVPDGFLALAEHRGEEKYRAVALRSGEALLRAQHPTTGILCEGWRPRQPLPGAAPQPGVDLAAWLSPIKINSRVGYAALAFAKLYHATGDCRYANALERLADGLEKYQNPDGSFPQDLRVDRVAPHSPLVKGHFLYYILNGTAQAAVLCPEVSALARIATRLGDFLLHWYRQTWALPYGNPHGAEHEPERHVWRSAAADAVAGLAWLTRLTGDPRYRQAACCLMVRALLSSVNRPDEPDVHGVIPFATAGGDDWAGGGYFHFWAILGLAALLASPSSCVTPRAGRGAGGNRGRR